MIVGGNGGGQGAWSPQELPNATAATSSGGDAASSGGDAATGAGRGGGGQRSALNCSLVYPGLCLPGGDIRRVNTSSPAVCCQQCSNTRGCVSWTVNTKDGTADACYLHATLRIAHASENCTSGSIAAPPTPAPPDPAAAPAFFDLVADFAEHRNVTDVDAVTVARLQAIVTRYARTKVPQKTGDPSCPGYAPRDSPQGKWVGPYCD